MQGRQRGISIINCILVIILIVFIIFISIIVYNGNDTNISEVTDINLLDESKSENVENRYYYNQVDDGVKLMYNTILKNIDYLKDGNTNIDFPRNDDITDSKFQTSWDAIKLDRPEIFYIDTSNLSLVTKKTIYFGNAKYSYSLQPKENSTYFIKTFSNQLDVENAITKLDSIMSIIKSNAIGTRYDKVKYIHDYLIDNVEYDESNDIDNSTIYGALIENKAVCEGYAMAFKYLLDNIDIPCVSIYGYGKDENNKYESHAWNYVKMEDNNWYAVDTTWDDPILIGNGNIPNDVKYKYFLKGSNEFFNGHKEDGDVSGTGQEFSYPTISKNNYIK